MIEFLLTEDHLKLIRHMHVGWQDCEFGAPEINPKRPYGNSSVILDIAEILDIDLPEDVEDCDENILLYMNRVHRETEDALQIVLQYGHIPGIYQCEKYSNKWKKK